jgi:hypothetical protein
MNDIPKYIMFILLENELDNYKNKLIAFTFIDTYHYTINYIINTINISNEYIK